MLENAAAEHMYYEILWQGVKITSSCSRVLIHHVRVHYSRLSREHLLSGADNVVNSFTV